MRLVFCFLLFLKIQAVLGQQYSIYPDNNILFFNNYTLTNPGYIADEGKLHFTSAYKMRLGPFDKIVTYSVTGARYIRSKEGKVHCIKGIFMNEKEGPYITKPRGYLNYAYSLKLGSNLRISAGLSLGLAGTSFSAPTATATSSTTVPDGAVGVTLSYKNLYGGIGVNQIINSVAVPLTAEFTYKRFYNLNLSFQKSLNAALKIHAAYQGFLYTDFLNNHLAASDLTYKEFVGAGITYQYNRGLGFYGRVTGKIHDDFFQMNLGYFTAMGEKENSGLSILELSLHYSFL